MGESLQRRRVILEHAAVDYRFIDAHVVSCHAASGKSPFKSSAAACAVELLKVAQSDQGFFFAVHDKAGYPVIDNFGNRAAVESDGWRSAGHSLNHGKPERFRPINWKQVRERVSQKIRFLGFIDFA